MKYDENEQEQEEQENIDRWLISYADFLTLLFTFFVALYALSTVDTKKVNEFSQSLNQAFRVIESPIKNVIIEKPEIFKFIESLKEKYKSADIEYKELPQGYMIRIQDKILFKSGQYELTDESKLFLDELSTILKQIPNKISIEGHTDNIPISSEFIRSNWDLSALRALSVLYYLREKGISPERLTATAHGEYSPIADNDTEEGREKNRRIEIIIMR
ncbi:MULTISPECIES: OmpA/MotB family protein [Thermodesulfovibrio]|jgi:chemotaxis protein MotB|uniref:OmpA/MotB family protein n=1 Tax=Thermodesulfovibrio TaxID=28261 RepID=UPI002617CBD9|nr:OmpA family protein [Thermodesulfovibrio sp.]